MNKVNGVIKVLLGFLLINSVVYAQSHAVDNNTAKAVFTIDNIDFDYGIIPENGGLANHVFSIKNTGNNPLVIKQVTASCGCTTPDWTKEPIASGKTGEIKVAYNPAGRPGPFSKTISVYCENADPVQLTIKGNVNKNDAEEKAPVLTFEEASHDFGTIGEMDGNADHVFKFVNTGNAPLSVTRVTASCGCTRPEWTQAPVEPGKEGVIIISFNPRGRLGNFNKSATVYTNEESGIKRHKLTILGNVVEKPTENLHVVYVDTIGGIGIEKNNFIFKSVSSSEKSKNGAYIKNNNPETAYFSWENIPDFISINCPDSLKAGWQGEIFITVDGTIKPDKRGRITDKLVLTIKDRNGKALGSENIDITANYLDDFNKLSPLQTVSAPILEIANAMINFGEIKSGFLGMGGNTSKQVVLTNKGKSDLILHSVTGDDSRVYLPDLKEKTVKAGESLTVNIAIKAKELEQENINTDIYVICNDPKGPVRLINVTAQKAK